MKTVYVIGSINMDLVIRTARMVEEGETISGNEFMTNAGGKGANQAVAVAKMGGRVHMVGNVGKLAFSQELIESLKKYGVNVDFVQSVEEISSGIAMIIVTENDNRIIIDSGANYTLTKADVDKALERAQEGDYLLTQMEILTEITEYALEMGKAKGMVTIFNPAPYKEISENAFKGLEYIIPNQKECEALTGIYPIDEISFKKASFILREKGVKKVIVTMGKKGSMYDDGSFKSIMCYPAKVVDTTAAGDTFIGTFAAMMAIGKEAQEALNIASKAAALTVSRKGAQQSIPYIYEIQ